MNTKLPEQSTEGLTDEAIIGLAVKHKVAGKLGPIGTVGGDVLYAKAGYKTHEILEFARAIAALSAPPQPVQASYTKGQQDERARCCALAKEYATWGGSNFHQWFMKLAAAIEGQEK
jgi:hypothetical protein